MLKDIPMFDTETGVSTLVLKEIPYKQVAYVKVQSVQPDGLKAHLQECVSFCRMCGAERIYERRQKSRRRLGDKLLDAIQYFGIGKRGEREIYPSVINFLQQLYRLGVKSASRHEKNGRQGQKSDQKQQNTASALTDTRNP